MTIGKWWKLWKVEEVGHASHALGDSILSLDFTRSPLLRDC